MQMVETTASAREAVQDFGRAFEPRERLDKMVLGALGWTSTRIEETLRSLYPTVLLERLILFEIMAGQRPAEGETDEDEAA